MIIKKELKFNQIVNIFSQAVNNSSEINDFFYGQPFETNQTKDTIYPALFFNDGIVATILNSSITYNITLWLLDQTLEYAPGERPNVFNPALNVITKMEEIAKSLIFYINSQVYLINDWNMVHVAEEFSERTYGVKINFDITLPMSRTSCDDTFNGEIIIDDVNCLLNGPLH